MIFVKLSITSLPLEHILLLGAKSYARDEIWNMKNRAKDKKHRNFLRPKYF